MNVLSLGGGVQSTTLLLMAHHGEIEPLDFAIFADTGWEPRAVYAHIERLRHMVSIPIVVVSVGNIYEDTLRGTLPRLKSPDAPFVTMPLYVKDSNETSLLRRQCTDEYKLKPIRRYIREQLRQRNEKVAQVLLGISFDEVHRMRDSTLKYIQHVYPLVEKRMRRSDCVAWLERHGYPVPPKSSCLGCPFHTSEYFRRLRIESPDEFAQVVRLDKAIRRIPRVSGECYIHRSCKPIEEAIDISQQELQFDECTGYCHT